MFYFSTSKNGSPLVYLNFVYQPSLMYSIHAFYVLSNTWVRIKQNVKESTRPMFQLIQHETVFAVRPITCVRGLNESNEYFFPIMIAVSGVYEPPCNCAWYLLMHLWNQNECTASHAATTKRLRHYKHDKQRQVSLTVSPGSMGHFGEGGRKCFIQKSVFFKCSRIAL